MVLRRARLTTAIGMIILESADSLVSRVSKIDNAYAGCVHVYWSICAADEAIKVKVIHAKMTRKDWVKRKKLNWPWCPHREESFGFGALAVGLSAPNFTLDQRPKWQCPKKTRIRALTGILLVVLEKISNPYVKNP